MVKPVFDFITRVLPDLLGLGRDLYELFDGDAEVAIAEIKDRRADIARRRARNDEALRKKYGDREGGSD